MKRRKTWVQLIIWLAATMLLFAACKDDEEEDNETKKECEALCDKFIDCVSEVFDPGMTKQECSDGCVDEAWHDMDCGSCWLDCDLSLDCADYIICMDSCPCEDIENRQGIREIHSLTRQILAD